MSKNVAVLWSGGLDSTFLIYKNLSEGNAVFAYYVEIENNNTKVIKEKEAIQHLSELFTKQFGDKFVYFGVLLKVSVNRNDDALSFTQLPMWIYALNWISIDSDEVQLGYCRNDDAISWLDDIKNIYDSFSVLKSKNIPLTFPLSKISKQEEKEHLPIIYYNNIWYCEDPKKGKPCGTCHSCIRYKMEGLVPEYDNIVRKIDNEISKLNTIPRIKDTISVEAELPNIELNYIEALLSKISDIKKEFEGI